MKHGVFYIFIFSLFLLPSCRKSVTDHSVSGKVVKVEVFRVGSLCSADVVRHSYVGHLAPVLSTPVRASMGGKLLWVNTRLQPSGIVRGGDTIAILDTITAAAAWRAANATKMQAEDAYRRLANMYAQGTITELQMVETQTKLEQARSAADIARRQLDDCFLTAPHDGLIDHIAVHAGQTLLPEQDICTIQGGGWTVLFYVPTPDILTDTDMAVMLDDTVFPARLNRISHTADPVTAQYQVEVAVPEHSSFFAGRSVSVMLTASANSIIIPAEAVRVLKDGAYVWLIRNGQLHHHPVTIGGFVQRGVIVETGLQTGDSVVVKGIQKCYEGAQIQ